MRATVVGIVRLREKFRIGFYAVVLRWHNFVNKSAAKIHNSFQHTKYFAVFSAILCLVLFCTAHNYKSTFTKSTGISFLAVVNHSYNFHPSLPYNYLVCIAPHLFLRKNSQLLEYFTQKNTTFAWY
jgi:hypothetical protein